MRTAREHGAPSRSSETAGPSGWGSGLASGALAAVGLLALACARPVGLEGRVCPCATDRGFACCETTGRCLPRAQAESAACQLPSSGPLDPPDPVPGLPPAAGPDAAAALDAGAAPDAAAEPDAGPPPVTAVPGRCLGGAGGVALSFYDHENLNGPVVERRSPGLIFDWGEGSPDPAIDRDSWSAIVSGRIQPEVSDTYTLFVRADEGFNLWLDGRLVLDFWSDPSAGRPVAVRAPLQAGRLHDFVVEYFDDLGGAFLDLTWQRPGTARTAIPQCALHEAVVHPARCPGPYAACPETERLPCPEDEGLGIVMRYFRDAAFKEPVFTEWSLPMRLDWTWLSKVPDPGPIGAVRMEGFLRAPLDEDFTFYLITDPGSEARLFLDGKQLLHASGDGSGVLREAIAPGVRLATGREDYTIRLDYVMRAPPATAVMSLRWQSPSIGKTMVSLCHLYGERRPIPR